MPSRKVVGGIDLRASPDATMVDGKSRVTVCRRLLQARGSEVPGVLIALLQT